MDDINQLINDLSKDATPVTPAAHPYALSLKWIAGGAAYIALALAISGLRPDLAQAMQQPWYIVECIALLIVFLTTSVSAALLAYPDLHQKRTLAFTPVAAFALFLTVLGFAWHADTPPAPLPVHSFECTISIVLVSLLPMVWTIYAVRKFASTHFMLAGAISLLSAFSVGALWLRLHEVNDSILHVVEWHYLPMLAVGLIGLWIGKLLLRW